MDTGLASHGVDDYFTKLRMDYLTFVVEFVRAVAWPAAIIVLVVLLRKPLCQLIPLLRKFKGAGVELEFGEVLAIVKAATAPGSTEGKTVEQFFSWRATEKELSLEERFAGVSTAIKVIEAWGRVELAANRLLERKNLPIAMAFDDMAELFEKNGFLSSKQKQLMLYLLQLRNLAAHQGDFGVSRQEAEEYRELADQLISELNSK
jgi:hypothetical protein